MPENILVHGKTHAFEMFYEGDQTWSMIVYDDQDRLVGEAITLGVGEEYSEDEDEEGAEFSEDDLERRWCEYHQLYHWPCF